MSIKTRAVTGIMIISVISLLSIMWISLSYLNKTNKSYIEEKTAAVAELIAVGISSALITDDIMTISSIVNKSVQQIRDIYSIEIFDSHNKNIVSHYNDIPTGINNEYFVIKEIPIVVSKTMFGKVRVTYDGMTLKELFYQIGIELTAAAILSIITSMLFAYITASWISKYINKMIESIIQLKNGISNEPLEWNSQTEIGKLAHSFNELVEDLKKQRNRNV